MQNCLVHLFHAGNQHKCCLLQSFSAIRDTLPQDHTNKKPKTNKTHSTLFVFYRKSSKLNKIQPLCIVLHKLQSVQLLRIYHVTAQGCTHPLSKEGHHPSASCCRTCALCCISGPAELPASPGSLMFTYSPDHGQPWQGLKNIFSEL